MRIHHFFAVIGFAALSFLNGLTVFAQDTERYPLIPRPEQLEAAEGNFTINGSTRLLSAGEEAGDLTAFIRDYLEIPLGKKLKTGKASGTGEENAIYLLLDPQSGLPEEGYELLVEPQRVVLKAASPAGLFWAFQSMRQLLPPSAEKERGHTLELPCVRIKDAPRFPYRGLHLDVARHMFPVDFIRKYIDLMALYKLNRFHWHLTDDQGWRVEIKKYPKLQEVAAFRKETLVGHYNDQPQRFDGKTYGGYYSQKEIREIVAYASSRHITVIPEIEMPGHALAALTAYPELGCTGGPYQVGTKWGIFDDIFCAGREETFLFLENVLTEVMELFPGKYIHIGGDEAPKTRWSACPRCQERIRKEGLKDELELQSYFVQRMEKFLNKHGRQIIGWDEILEGGLAPNATVMSWRGTEGAVEAARQGHDVIMTPNGQLYLDHYQSQAPGEPLAIGGYTTVQEVYEYEPVPQTLKPSEASHILGVQGNLWTEYIPSPKQAEYMVYPRAVALSEVVWSRSADRDYKDFTRRLKPNLERLAFLGVNFAAHVFDVQAEAKIEADGILLQLWSNDEAAAIHYTLDGSEPSPSSPRYTGPVPVRRSGTLKAVRVRDGKVTGGMLEQELLVHKALGKEISLSEPPHESYSKGGAQALVDGQPGSDRTSDNWLAWSGKDMEAVIDLGEPDTVHSISLNFGNATGQWIYAPKAVEVLFSYDGFSFTPFYEDGDILSAERHFNLKIPVGEGNIRYIKVVARNFGKIPEGRQGAGHEAWLFLDEIIVE